MLTDVVKIEGRPELIRDPLKSGVIKNTDTEGYKAYMNARNIHHQNHRDKQELRQELDELKSMLQRLLDK